MLNRFSSLAALGAFVACSHAQTTSWIGPTSGNWNVRSNWAAGVIPGSDATLYDVVIDGNSDRSVEVFLESNAQAIGFTNVRELTVTAGDSLIIEDITGTGPNLRLNAGTNGVATLNIDGSLRVGGTFTGSVSSSAQRFVVQGTGTLALRQFSFSPTGILDSTGVLELGSALRIEGAGEIRGFASVINRATVSANVPEESLSVSGSSGVSKNLGVLRAENGGGLSISGTWENFGAQIDAGKGSVVDFAAQSRFIGGKLTGDGTFALGSRVTLRDVEIQSTIAYRSFSSELSLGGAIQNVGQIRPAEAGFSQGLSLVFLDNVSLSGTGTIDLNFGDMRKQFGAATASLINSSTIRNIRTIADLASNSGRLESDGSMSINLSANPLMNSGTILTRGGVLEFSHQNTTTINNAGGTILSDGGGIRTRLGFGTLHISGGTIGAINSGSFNVTNTVRLTDLTLLGKVALGGTLQLAGTIHNLGHIMPTVGIQRIALGSDEVRLLGSGSIEIDGQFSFPGFITGNNAQRLLNLQNTIVLRNSATSSISLATIPKITNAATIEVPFSGSIYLAPGSDAFINQGTINVGSSLLFRGIVDNRNVINLNGLLAIDYAEGSSSLPQLEQQIKSGHAGGDWDGVGIHSKLAVGNASFGIGYAESADVVPGVTFFSGLQIDGTTALARLTLLGDADLNRIVNISDFSRLAANFGEPSEWFEGDFNYDGVTGIEDFALMAGNFNATFPLSRTAVPEPMNAFIVAAIYCAGARRRR